MTPGSERTVCAPLWPAALWMGGIRSARLSPRQSRPVQFLFPKFVILGPQRFLVSYTPELKSVNMYLGQFQWPHLVVFFPPQKIQIVYHHFGREKRKKGKKKNVCKSFLKKNIPKRWNWPYCWAFLNAVFWHPRLEAGAADADWPPSADLTGSTGSSTGFVVILDMFELQHLAWLESKIPPPPLFFCFWEKKNWKWDVECNFETTTLPHVHPIKIR